MTTPAAGQTVAGPTKAPAAAWLTGLVATETVAAVTAAAVAALCDVGLPVVARADGTLEVAAEGTGLSGRGWDDPRWLRLQQRVLGHPSVAALREDAALVAALSRLAGGPVSGAAGDIVRVAFPGQPRLTTRPHQDGFYITDPERLWTVWMPLVPCPLALGALAVIPTSHAGGLRPHETRDLGVPELASVAAPALPLPPDSAWEARAMEPGDALAFPGFTVHASLPNLTARAVRLSVDLRYQRGDPSDRPCADPSQRDSPS